MKRIPESEIGRVIRVWLESEGWETWAEVSPFGTGRNLGDGGRADLAARREGKILIVETKTSLGFAVIEQAVRWARCAHFVAVGVPSRKYSEVAIQTLKVMGVGMIGASIWGERGTASWIVEAREQTSPVLSWVKAMGEAEKRSVPGSLAGDVVTDYKIMCERLADHLRVRGPLTLRECFDQVPAVRERYRSLANARGSLAGLVRRKVLWGVEIVEGRPIKIKARRSET